MLVSILINNYNYAKYLEEAIASALSQTYDAVEVVVVDDGSKDESKQIIEKFGDRIISVFQENGGQASAINSGFQKCKGELVLLLDADDYFYKIKASEVIKVFNHQTDIGWYFHKLSEVDSSGKSISRPERKAIQHYEKVDLRHIMTKGYSLNRWFTATSGLCFRREIFKDILPIPDQIKISADSFIRLAALYLSPGILSPDCLATHRKHSENLYDFRSDIQIERMRLGIKTAYYLQHKFPETRPFSQKQFSFCLGRLIEYSTLDQVLSIPELKLYFRQERSLPFRAQATAYAIKGLLDRRGSEQRK